MALRLQVGAVLTLDGCLGRARPLTAQRDAAPVAKANVVSFVTYVAIFVGAKPGIDVNGIRATIHATA